MPQRRMLPVTSVIACIVLSTAGCTPDGGQDSPRPSPSVGSLTPSDGRTHGAPRPGAGTDTPRAPSPHPSTSTTSSTSPSRHHSDFQVLKVGRVGCRQDGSSTGFALDLAVKGFGQVALSAGAYTPSNPEPLVSDTFTPRGEDWRGRIVFHALGGHPAQLPPGRLSAQVGISDTHLTQHLASRTTTVTIPDVSSNTCW